MRNLRGLAVVALLVAPLSCADAAPDAEFSVQAARADSVGMAMAAFDASIFDTIAWATEEERTDRGRLVFRISCSKCHGPNGEGDGRFVLQGDTLTPPSFLAPDWGFASAPMELRRYIFSGNVAGMPYWGLVGLKYRDIDAVAHFLETPLRVGIGSHE